MLRYTYLASLLQNQELGVNRNVTEICTKSITVIRIRLCGCFGKYVGVWVICVCFGNYVGVLVICVLAFTVFFIICTAFLYCFFYVYLFLFVLSVLL